MALGSCKILQKNRLSGIVFWIVFLTMYLFGGVLYALGIPFRTGFVSLLVIPLLVVFRIRRNSVFIYGAFYLLAVEIFCSGLFNSSSLTQIVASLRTPLFAFLSLVLTVIYLDQQNIVKVLRWCIHIAMVQLPVVVIQIASYKYLPSAVKVSISSYDFDFGTFTWSNDAGMTTFLAFVVIFILFSKDSSLIVNSKYRYFVSLWISFTVLLCNSEVTKMLLLLVWLMFFLQRVSLVRKLQVLLVLVLVLGAAVGIAERNPYFRQDLYLSKNGLMSTDYNVRQEYLGNRYSPGVAFAVQKVLGFWVILNNNLSFDTESQYLDGYTTRGGALAFYSNKVLSLFGEGPGSSYNVLTRERQKGDAGHFFLFYSELGLAGFLLSYHVMYLVALDGQRKATLMRLLYFSSMVVMSLTVDVMNNVSIFFAYCIFAIGTTLLDAGKPPVNITGHGLTMNDQAS